MGSILLVDDQPITNFITRKLLEIEGVKMPIRDFTNPLKALEDVKANSDSFIFLDLNMPEMNGWQFMDKLMEYNLRPKIVILTSSTSNLDKERAKDYPFVIDFVIKPLSKLKFSDLSTLIAEAI